MNIWRSQWLPNETGRQAAARFIAEYFGADRVPKFSGDGYFRFADGASYYQIKAIDGYWEVTRTSLKTPAAKKRSKARREARGEL